MKITFTTANDALTLSSFGSGALIAYAVVGVTVISIATVNLVERGVVAYKKRLIRKINED